MARRAKAQARVPAEKTANPDQSHSCLLHLVSSHTEIKRKLLAFSCQNLYVLHVQNTSFPHKQERDHTSLVKPSSEPGRIYLSLSCSL